MITHQKLLNLFILNQFKSANIYTHIHIYVTPSWSDKYFGSDYYTVWPMKDFLFGYLFHALSFLPLLSTGYLIYNHSIMNLLDLTIFL